MRHSDNILTTSSYTQWPSYRSCVFMGISFALLMINSALIGRGNKDLTWYSKFCLLFGCDYFVKKQKRFQLLPFDFWSQNVNRHWTNSRVCIVYLKWYLSMVGIRLSIHSTDVCIFRHVLGGVQWWWTRSMSFLLDSSGRDWH